MKKRSRSLSSWGSLAAPLGLAAAIAACGSRAPAAPAPVAAAVRDATTRAPDGVALHYVVGEAPAGAGPDAPALVFVHGWTGDVHFWDRQLPFFSRTHRVLALDLAGHGQSGQERARYDAESYANDVRAVADAAGVRRMILVGHSMSGNVVVEAAARMPERVVGVIGVDCYHDLGARPTKDTAAAALAGSERYEPWVRNLLGSIFGPSSPEQKERVIANAARLDGRHAIATLRWNFEYVQGPVAASLRVPLGTVNGDKFPTDVAGARRLVPSFRVVVLKETGHYPMLERPDAFNDALALLLVELGLVPASG